MVAAAVVLSLTIIGQEYLWKVGGHLEVGVAALVGTASLLVLLVLLQHAQQILQGAGLAVPSALPNQFLRPAVVVAAVLLV